MKIAAKILCIVLVAVFCTLSLAACSSPGRFYTSGYTTTEYQVMAVVSEDKVYDITKMNDARRPDWIVMGCMGLLALAALIIFLIFRRGKKPTRTVEFYPPDGLTPAEVGYIIDGVADERGQAAMLLYWADRGYLSIRAAEGDFELTRLKELGKEAKPFERQVFKTLFRAGDTVLAAQSRFFMAVFDVQRMIAASFGKASSPFTKEPRRMQGLLTFFAWLPLFATLTMSINTLGEGWWFGVLMGLIASAVMMMPLLGIVYLLREWSGRSRRWLKLGLWLAMFTGLNVFYAFVAEPTFMEPLRPATAALSALLIALLAGFTRKRTDGSGALMSRIMGFKDFITLAEKDRIERLAEKDPGYFYNILPYAYVLGVTDRWVKHFAGMLHSPPAWFKDTEYFTPQRFMYHMDSAMAAFQASMTPSRSGSGGSSSHSGSSGGSFSGGGGGIS